MKDKFKDECGVFGIFSKEIDIAQTMFLGLYALQHRGQESAGIVSSDEKNFYHHKHMGLVHQSFNKTTLKKLKGHLSIGHVRYSTRGASKIENAQPIIVQYKNGNIAIAHNGTIVNATTLKKQLEKQGSIFQSSVDSEVIVHLIARSQQNNIKDALKESLQKIKGAYSLLLMTNNEIIATRDPLGFRPLCIGTKKNSYFIASESCALEQIGAKYLREVKPNEMIIINNNGLSSLQINNTQINNTQKPAMCVFELIYLARPDSIVFNKSVYLTRKKLGKELGKEHPINVDVIIPVPDSGIPSAIGYSEQTKIPYEMGLLRNHYVGRTFIQPQNSYRNTKVRIKLSPVSSVIKNKKVAIIDDSIVRGTTCKEIVRMIKAAGAKEIHILVTSPPINHPCYYGIDTPNTEELIAPSFKGNCSQIANYLEANSLHYLSMESLVKVVIDNENLYCKACFNGKYPVTPTDFI